MLETKQRIKLIGFAVGIIISYTLMGVAIEKCFKGNFDSEKFVFPIAFVAVQCIFFTIVAKVAALSSENYVNETPQKYFVIVAVLWVISSITASMALTLVSYPFQVIAKACKPIPVMLFGALLARKSYTPQKYFSVILIVFGIAIFIYQNNCDNDDLKGLFSMGNILIGISLLADGLLAACQELMRKVSRPTALNFMLYMNAWSSLILIAILIANGEGFEFYKFTTRHPQILLYIGVVLVAGSFGQYFIFNMLANFGSLPLSITTTLRKFFTVLLSCLIYKNTLSVQQWMATGIIFTALSFDMLFGSKSESKEEKTKDEYVAKESEQSSV